MANKIYTFTQAKSLLNAKFGYSQKDIKTDNIIVAMFAQEDIMATIITNPDSESSFSLEETYVIKDFTKPLTVVKTTNTSSIYTIGDINVLDLMTNYQKDKFNLDLWCYLANQADGTILNLDEMNATLFPSLTEEKVVMLFDELVVLGYLKETETNLVFNIDKQETTYVLKKHNGMRFADYIKKIEEEE